MFGSSLNIQILVSSGNKTPMMHDKTPYNLVSSIHSGSVVNLQQLLDINTQHSVSGC